MGGQARFSPVFPEKCLKKDKENQVHAYIRGFPYFSVFQVVDQPCRAQPGSAKLEKRRAAPSIFFDSCLPPPPVRPLERMATLCSLQQELDFYRFKWENDTAVFCTVKDAGVKERSDIAVNGLYIAARTARSFAD
jgi:hypothetical protein